MKKRTPEQKIYEVRTAYGIHGYNDMELEKSTKEELEELKTLTEEGIKLEAEKRAIICEIQEKCWEVQRKYPFIGDDCEDFGDEECILSEEAEEQLKYFLSEINEELTIRNTLGAFEKRAEQQREAEEQRREAEERRIQEERAKRLPRYVISMDLGDYKNVGLGTPPITERIRDRQFKVEYWKTEDDIPSEELIEAFCVKEHKFYFHHEYYSKDNHYFFAFSHISTYYDQLSWLGQDDFVKQECTRAKEEREAVDQDKK